MTPEDLVRAMAAGDRSAVAPFYDRLSAEVYGLALAILGDRDVAVDVVGDVFWEAWARADSGDLESHGARAWILRRTATHAADRHHATTADRDEDRHQILETLAAASAVGGIEDAVSPELEAHLATGCARCVAARRDPESVMSRLASAPPAEARAKLLARLAATAPGQRRLSGRVAGVLAGLIGLVLGGALAGIVVAARYEARLGRLARDAAAYRAVVDTLREPGTRVILLRGAGTAGGSEARVVWNDSRGGQLLVGTLPPCPPGRIYAVWAISGRTWTRTALFNVPDVRRGDRPVPLFGTAASVEAFAVTLEPLGAGSSPSAPTVLSSR